jgi:hypothetical protein
VLTIDDFVMLGKTVPEPNSDDRVFVCSAGVSPTLRQLIRIYPLARTGAPARWATCAVTLERNPKDSRGESFKLAGDRTPAAHGHINEVFKVGDPWPEDHRADLLRGFTVDSLAEANAHRRSLAVIHPEWIELDFEFNPESPASPQLQLFDTSKPVPEAGAKRFPFIPRLRFGDEGGTHRLMLRDWGAYEFLRKHDAARRFELANALHLDGSASLLVGNFNRHRNSWLVISVLRGIRPAPSLFDHLTQSEVA